MNRWKKRIHFGCMQNACALARPFCSRCDFSPYFSLASSTAHGQNVYGHLLLFLRYLGAHFQVSCMSKVDQHVRLAILKICSNNPAVVRVDPYRAQGSQTRGSSRSAWGWRGAGSGSHVQLRPVAVGARVCESGRRARRGGRRRAAGAHSSLYYSRICIRLS